MIELDKIYNEDCLEGMKRIPDGSVDMILTDLPYQQLSRQNKDAQWDILIPFEPLWEQLLRVTKSNAAIVLFCQGMFTCQLMMSQPKLWRYNLIWKKGNRVTGFLNANRMPMRNHEDIAVFYRSLPTYNPQMEEGFPNHSRGHGRGKCRCYGKYDTTKFSTEKVTDKYPKSVIDIPSEHTGDNIHPTQKPVDLLRWLIRTYSNKGETILDSCMGSGTTAIAAIREKRHFVGFELDEGYYSKACARIEREKRNLEIPMF